MTLTRRKPYTAGLATMDAIFLFFSCGMWLFVVVPREMYNFFGPKN